VHVLKSGGRWIYAPEWRSVDACSGDKLLPPEILERVADNSV
jgi:hypothetical protein